jgi:dTMP kinase
MTVAMNNPAGRESPRGRFLVLDGPDGGGKTTQAADLAGWLRTRGFEVVACRDPGGTALGDRLRAILQDRAMIDVSFRAEMLLFMASRAQLVEQVVRPAIEAGQIVVSDRYLLANIVYQGYAGGLGVETVASFGRVATDGLLPDLTILLDIPFDQAKGRIGRARDRIEERPTDYHEKVRAGFLKAAADSRAGDCSYYPQPIVLVDATGDPIAVRDLIRSEVERALALDPRP